MRLKTSFFNKGILLDDLKKFGWIGVMYAMALFFVVPLNILMIMSKEEISGYGYEVIKNLFLLKNSEAQGFLMLIFPVLLGIFLFRYIQTKSSTDMMHSFPIKRTVMYKTHIFVGILMIVIPVIIIAIISSILNNVFNLSDYYNTIDIFKWMGFTILIDIVAFMSCVLVGMITGISVVQGVLTYILMFLPAGLIVLVTYNIKTFLYGYTNNIENLSEKLSPIIRAMNGYYQTMSITEVSIYILICIILYFLSQYLYNRRKLEGAGQAIAFSTLQMVFKYGVTLCMMMFGGFYFYQTQGRGSIGWIIFGYISGTIIGYFAAEMLLRKSIWVFRNIKGLGIYIAVMILLILGMQFDVTGYEKRMPDINNVEKVYFSGDFYSYNSEKYKNYIYSDKNNIKNIYALHNQIIKDKKLNKFSTGKSSRSVVFVYQLKNGKKLSREYTIDNQRYDSFFKPIRESLEDKKMTNEVLNITPMDVEKIIISPNSLNRQAVILKPSDIKEAIEVLSQDVKDETYDNMKDRRVPWANIEIMISDNKIKKYPRIMSEDPNNKNTSLNMSFKKYYSHFEEWLKQKGYLENARLMPGDVAYAVVEKAQKNQDSNDKMDDGINLNNKNVKRLEIRDKAQIEVCLRNYSFENSESEDDKGQRYIIGFYSKDKTFTEYGSFEEENLPDFIKDYFRQ